MMHRVLSLGAAAIFFPAAALSQTGAAPAESAGGRATRTAAASQQTPATPPVLAEAEEIALARTAAPAAVTEGATILVLRNGTYEIGHAGTSGVTCMVSRAWPLSLEPICFDPEASRTVMAVDVWKVEMRLAGVEADEIDRRIEAAIGSGEIALPRRPAVAYMMSPKQVLYADAETRVGAWKPHMHIYMPYATAEQFGGLSGEGSMAAGIVFDEGKPTANLVIPLREFVEP
jgi:hypothetical protein